MHIFITRIHTIFLSVVLLTITEFLFAESIRVGMFKYKLDETAKTATVVGCEITGDLDIPEQIVINEIPFKVTAIGERAFYKDIYLQRITFPRSLVSIGKEAFFGCSSLCNFVLYENVNEIHSRAFASCFNLSIIYCFRQTPITIDYSVFEGVNMARCKILVPPDFIESYKAASEWKNFKNIYPFERR